MMKSMKEFFSRKQKFSSFQVEMANLTIWSAIGNGIGGFFLLAFWYLLSNVESISRYVPYAYPLISPSRIQGMLVLSIILFAITVLSVITDILVLKGNKRAKAFLMASGLSQVWLPIAGTFFGLVLVFTAMRMPREFAGAEETQSVLDDTSMNRFLMFLVLYTWLVVVGLFLFYPAVYILPIEFINDEDLFWLRQSFWLFFQASLLVATLAAGFFTATSILVVKRMKGWKLMLGISCFVMLFMIPVGPYVAGVIYRNLLVSRNG